MLNWISDDEFFIDDIKFKICLHDVIQRESEDKDFTLVKTKSFLKTYLEMNEKFDHILELGMYQGGSLVFFDKIFKPVKMVGLDIRQDEIKPLENYIESNDRNIKTYCNASQDDEELLLKIVEDDMDGKLDLVVDDASHMYELTKKSFRVLFPVLKAGGVYVIEDWAWSLNPTAQSSKHPWYKKPALVNLVFEIVMELGGSYLIENFYITRDMMVIRKSCINTTVKSVLVDINLRGHKMSLV